MNLLIIDEYKASKNKSSSNSTYISNRYIEDIIQKELKIKTNITYLKSFVKAADFILKNNEDLSGIIIPVREKDKKAINIISHYIKDENSEIIRKLKKEKRIFTARKNSRSIDYYAKTENQKSIHKRFKEWAEKTYLKDWHS